MKTRRHAFTALILLMVLVTACNRSSDDGKPSVKILSPSDQYAIGLGETLRVESRARDDEGISQIELQVNGAQVNLYSVPKGELSFRVEQSWLPTQPGTYSVTVIAHDSKGQMSEPATITVSVGPGTTPTPSLAPTVTPVTTSTPEQPAPISDNCTYNAAFVTDVNIPDNTELAPGSEFVKTWRLRNTGTCEWGPGFQFVFVDGAQMGGPPSVEVAQTPAGATVDVSVHFKAPQEPGSYRSIWRVRRPDGQGFGDRPYVKIIVLPLDTPTPPATPTATAPPKPDLDITLVSGNLDLLVGQPLALQVTIRNHGPGATDQSALVRAVLQPGLEIEGSVPTLPAGGEVLASISHVFNEPAALEVWISVDPNDEINETDESNNSARLSLIINPPLYVTGTITVTPGLRFDLDKESGEEEQLDIEWRVVEGTVYLGLFNGAGAAPLHGEAKSVSYALVSGLTWETGQLVLPDLNVGSLFALRTSDDRVGYARVDTVPDQARTSARLSYFIWDWP